MDDDYGWAPDPFYDGHVKSRMRRASGDVTCEICGLIYYKHPRDREHLDRDGEPYLRQLCDGSLVKL